MHAYTSGRLLGWLAGCAVTKFVLFAMWATINDDFRLVIYDAGLTLAAMLLMASWFAWLQRQPSAPWILAGVMTAMEKSDIAFKTLLAIRAKLMDAYEEIKNMPI